MKLLNYVKIACAALLNIVGVNAIGQVDTTRLDITELNLEQLQNVKIITASKTLLEASQAPASVIVVTEEQIRIRGYRSLLDVLSDVPDLKIDDKAYSLSRSLMTMRGVEGQEKFIIMLDGVRISSATNESLPIMENYPVNLAKQIEIIYGPASALYGADAFSGIINIITKKAAYTSSRGEASFIAGDHGLFNGSIFTSKKLSDDIVLTLSGQYFSDEGVNMSKEYGKDPLWDFSAHKSGTFNTIYGPMTPSAPVKNKYETPLKAHNLYAGLKAGEFTFSLFTNYSQNSSALENNPNNAVYNADVFYGRSVTSVSASHTRSLDRFTFTTMLSGHQYRVDPKSNYRNMYSGMEPAYKYGYSLALHTEEQVEWRVTGRTNLVGGAVLESFFSLPESADLQDPVTDYHAVEGTLLNTPSYYRPEGLEAKFYAVRYYNVGGYLQLQQKIFKQTNVTVGARFDHNSRFGSTFNPRMGIVLNPLPKTTIKVMAGAAYLAPTPGSTYSYYGTFYTLDSGRTYQSNFYHLPNPGLKPMKSNTVELSVRQYLGSDFSVSVTGYYNDVTNLVDFASDQGNTNLYQGKFLGWDVDYIEVFVNRGHRKIAGASLQLGYNRNIYKGWINAYSYISYVDGSADFHRTDQVGAVRHFEVELSSISHWMLKSGVDLTVSRFTFSPRVIWTSPQHIAGFVDVETPGKRQEIPGYTLLNVSAGYRLGTVHVFGSISNALNQTYRSVGPNMDLNNSNTELFYGNYQDPIRFNVGIRLNF